MVDVYRHNQLKRKYGNEQVLVMLTQDVQSVPDGFSLDIDKNIKTRIWSSHRFIYRYDAEYNLALTQLIPYVVVTNTNEDKLYVAERISGEERLRKTFQLGCGGHVNPSDVMGFDTIGTAAIREMNEELVIDTNTDEIYLLGTVRDLSSSTKEHLGIVYLVHSDDVSIREKNTLRGQWMNMSDLILNYEKFESWARYIIDHLFKNNKNSGKLFI